MWKLAEYRSGGFLNKDYDMARIYKDLPIIEAKKLLNELNKTESRPMITDHQRDKEINGLIDNEFLFSLDHHVHDDIPVIALGLLGAAHTAQDEHKPAIYQRIGELMYQHTLNEVTQYCTQSVDAEIEREGL